MESSSVLFYLGPRKHRHMHTHSLKNKLIHVNEIVNIIEEAVKAMQYYLNALEIRDKFIKKNKHVNFM